ncbi:alkaline phosphatase family protein [Flagellimonas sp. HMM57]|uniref:alkaline phosphatase D family protein n=1 Tax=unclassified Flagellimonas TaxID=2644544 RepID=UPI0013D76194|nr:MULTISPECIES: alkaline phosphatase D family protein [unclassified Flagellimonas]UII75270.1 alkaline phosphatase family protein [Flagellimonas sp. HMM57]
MKYFSTVFSAVVFFFGCKSQQAVPSAIAQNTEKSGTVFTIAFGSCNKQDVANPFWDDILNENPDVWIWGGDNIYADTENMDELKSMYSKQLGNEGYKLLNETTPVIGTWDDHDYGLNDGGEEFSMKKESQQLFLDFMGVPKDSKRRNQEGVYTSHLFETPKGKVKILVLDTRYFRSSLESDPDPKRRYKPNTNADATILGNAQWDWLQKELDNSEADFNLIVTSIQFLSGEHGFESWSNFPKDVEKLKNSITSSGAKGVMILSGDRHISEFSKVELPQIPYSLIDFTSSGLTHSYSDFTSEPNRFRIGEVMAFPSFGIITLHLETREAHLKMMGENGLVFQELKQAY